MENILRSQQLACIDLEKLHACGDQWDTWYDVNAALAKKTTVIGITVTKLNSGRKSGYKVQCKLPNTDLSKFTMKQRVSFQFKDKNGQWKWEYRSGTILESGNGSLRIGDDWKPKKKRFIRI